MGFWALCLTQARPRYGPHRAKTEENVQKVNLYILGDEGLGVWIYSLPDGNVMIRERPPMIPKATGLCGVGGL